MEPSEHPSSVRIGAGPDGSLTYFVAHEIAHIMTARRLGRRGYLALETWQRSTGDHRISVAWTLNGLGTIAYDAGRYAEAEALYEHAISISEENNNKATYLNNFATAYLKQDRDQSQPK